MVQVGLIVILGDVHRWLKAPGVRGRLDRYPEHQGAEVIQGEAPTLLLRVMGLCLSMASGFNGVMNIVIITDMVARGGTPRRKVVTLLLPRLGASSM
jgi:hypothetical protein